MQDRELLRQFVASASQEAFAQIVHRHMDAVYAAARRQVRDPQLAEDITQAVFIVLARKARKLQTRDSLAGWLMKTTHLASLDALKMKSRRTRHEQQAASLNQSRLEQNMTPQWQVISPQLDQALSQLSEKDRSAVTLRYLEQNTTAETAITLGISEQAAAKRISRAVDRLRRFLIRKSVLPPSASLAILLEQIPRASAPASFVHGVTITASAGAATPAGLTIANGVIHIMTCNKIITAILLIAGITSATGIGIGTVKLLAGQTDSPMAATPAPDSPSAPDQPVGSIARLSNGISLQILGVNESPSTGKQWWLPNGDPQTVAPYAHMYFYVPSSKGDIVRELALTINRAVQGNNEPPTVVWYIPNSHGSSSGNITGAGIKNVEAQTFELSDASNGATLRANVAAGRWNTLIKVRSSGQMVEGVSKNSYLFSSVFEIEDMTHIVVAWTGHATDDMRLVAVDRAGHRMPAMPRNSISTRTNSVFEYAVPVPASSIKQWELQSRPFDQWIEFRNISLHRGQSTDLKIVTSDDKK